MLNSIKIINNSLNDHERVFKKTRKLVNKIDLAAKLSINCLDNGGKILWCGNGGSSSDSMHLSAELVGKFKKKRISLPSISLASNPATLTCIANDFGFENIFSRQIQSLGINGDVLIAISTSGKSKNIFNAIKMAKKKSLKVIALLGNDGGLCKDISDLDIIINSKSTARIQEMHILIGQIICNIIEEHTLLKND